MIRRTLEDHELLVPQHEHALQAGRFAALLRDLPAPAEAVVRAVALHDAGWPLLDDLPEPLPDGRSPHLFELPPGASTPAWRRSVAIARACGPLEGLLVSRHFARFSADFAEEQAAREAAWRTGVEPATEVRGGEVLALCDALSLRLLCDPDERLGFPDAYRLEDGCLDPWPFVVDEVVDTVVARRLPRRKWSSANELRQSWAAAPRVPRTVRLHPA